METGEKGTIAKTISYGYMLVCAAVGSKIYIFGGSSSAAGDPNNQALCFDTETNELTALGVSYKTIHAAAVAVGTDIHLFGGRTSSTSSSYTNQHKIYNTETGEMTDGTTIALAYGQTCAYDPVDNVVYLIGGTSSSPFKSIYRYDPASDSRSVCPVQLDVGKVQCGACVVGRRLYIFAGASSVYSSGTKYNDISYYDLDSGTLVKLPLTCYSGRYVGATLYGDDIFLVTYNGSVYAYKEQIGKPYLEKDNLQLIRETDGSVFKLFNADTLDVETVVGSVYLGDENNGGDLMEACIYKDGEWVAV